MINSGLDLTGKKFGSLKVIGREEKRVRYRVIWICKCDCGNTSKHRQDHLIDGSVKSCGCYGSRTTHNMSKLPVYRSWHGMMARCYNKKNNHYNNYGERGIVVCDRWHNFENFYSDMGDRPKDRTLNRIDNNGNYELSNCDWATKHEQDRNKRTNRFITFEGITKTITDWASYFMCSKWTFSSRLKTRGTNKAFEYSIKRMFD